MQSILKVLTFLKKITTQKILSRRIFTKFLITTLTTSNILLVESKPYEVSNFNSLEPGSLNISVYIFHFSMTIFMIKAIMMMTNDNDDIFMMKEIVMMMNDNDNIDENDE